MSRSRPRTAAAAVAACLAAVLVAGCSSDDDPTAGTDVVVAPRAAVRDGGTLRWAVEAPPATLNAFQTSADATTALVTGAVLPSLFRLDGRGRPGLDPDYLRSADVVATRPHQVVVYRLNPKAVWSDGRPVTAADFVAQWQALRGTDQGFWAAHNAGYDRITDVRRGADDREVRVAFGTPYADWRALFTPLYPRSVTGSANAFDSAARTALPVVAGPFAVRSVTAAGVTLVRNPGWWGDRAKLDRLLLTPVPPAARPAALAAGRLDVAELDPDHRGRLAVHKALAAAYTQLTLNGGPGRPLADERVRQAVARAVDRRAIAKSVLGPLGLPAEPLGNHLLMAGQPGYTDHSSALGSGDTREVRALLTAAGWRPASPAVTSTAAEAGASPAAALSGDAGPQQNREHLTAAGAAAPAGSGRGRQAAVGPALMKNGRPLVLRLLLPEGQGSTLERVAARIAAQLAAVGITTDTVRVADEDFFRDHIAAGDFDLALFSWPATAYPATDDQPVFAKPRPAVDGSLTVEQNYSRVGTDRIDQLLDQAAAELDAGAARTLAAQADARIWAEAGSVPLFQRPELVALAPRVVGAGAFGFATPRWQDMGFRK